MFYMDTEPAKSINNYVMALEKKRGKYLPLS